MCVLEELHYLNNLYVLQILSYATTDGRLWEKPLCYVRSSGVHPFLRNIPMLLHLDLMRHSDIPFNVNEKLNKEVIRTTSKVLREDCIMVQIWGGLYNLSCCREGSQELSDHVVQVRAQAQPPSCLVCLDEILHCIQQPLALNRCY